MHTELICVNGIFKQSAIDYFHNISKKMILLYTSIKQKKDKIKCSTPKRSYSETKHPYDFLPKNFYLYLLLSYKYTISVAEHLIPM